MNDDRRPTEKERADALDSELDEWLARGGEPPVAGVEQLAALGNALADAGVPAELFDAAWERSGPRRARWSSWAPSRAAAVWIVVALFAGFFVGQSTMGDDGSDARLISEVDQSLQEISEAVGEARGYEAAGRPDLADGAIARATSEAERARLLSKRLGRSERRRFEEILRRRLVGLPVDERTPSREPGPRDGSSTAPRTATTTTIVRYRETTTTLVRHRDTTTTTQRR